MKTPKGAAQKLLRDTVGHQGKDCLIWPFHRRPSGYGWVNTPGRRPMTVNRAMCILAHGEPPTPKHEAAHSCHNGHLGCFNPNHLRWATAQENADDRKVSPRHPRGSVRPMIFGSKNVSVRLTEEQVLQIVKDPRPGIELAQLFGVSNTNICNIRNGKAWSWLTGIKRKTPASAGV